MDGWVEMDLGGGAASLLARSPHLRGRRISAALLLLLLLLLRRLLWLQLRLRRRLLSHVRLDELAQKAHRVLVRAQLVPLQHRHADHRPALALQQPLREAHLKTWSCSRAHGVCSLQHLGMQPPAPRDAASST